MMWFVLLCSFVFVEAQYEVPPATVEPLYPKGFRVSIPQGIKLFAFHGKLNEELEGREGGTFSRDILKPKNGRWTFTDKITELKKGDILYYWTYVDYFDGKNKLGYTNDDQVFVVEDLIDDQKNSQTTLNHCEATVTKSNLKNICKNQIIFDENFVSELRDNWTVEQRYADAPDYEFVMYMNRPESLQVINGFLNIKPILSEDIFGNEFLTSKAGYNFGLDCTGLSGSPACSRKYEAGFILPPIVSSQISTRNKFSFKFGKIEVRAKLPKGDWIYPEIFLNPAYETYGPNYHSGQIRIAFIPGNTRQNQVLHGGIILGNNQASREYGDKTISGSQSWSDDFHTFTVLWKPDGIHFGVDGNIYGNIYPPDGGFASLESKLKINTRKWKSGSKLAPFDQEMYITLGVGVGGYNFKDRGDGSKPWKNGDRLSFKKFDDDRTNWRRTWGDNSKLIVDYVKVTAI